MRVPAERAETRNKMILLLLSYCLLVAAKSLLSLRFQSPWLLPDEVSYAEMAADIFGSVQLDLPRGYPFFLSIAYLSSDDMMVVYHWMLIINSLFSSLIIFPAYFILSKYCSRDFSFLGAMTVATLPSLNLYTFLVMSENLFIPLFTFSIWFLIEAFETERPLWIALAVLSVSLLFFTRHSGIFMVAAMTASLIYYLHSRRLTGDGQERELSKRRYIIFIVLLVFSLALFGLVLTGSDRGPYFDWFYYRIITDSQTLLSSFGDCNQLKDFFVTLRNEVGYLILASYFVFSYIAVMFFFKLFFTSGQESGYLPNGWLNLLSREEMTSLKSVSIYYIVASFLLLFATTTTAYELKQTMGRYINPLIPGLFLFGLIGLYKFNEDSAKPNFKLITVLAIIFSLIFFFRFPKTDLEAIYYLNFFESFAPSWMAFPALAACFFILVNIYNKRALGERAFFAFLMIFSISASAYTYQADLVLHSDANYRQNQIGDYLNAHPNDDFLIIVDENISIEDWYFEAMTKFWTRKDIIDYPIDGDLSYFKSDEIDIYLITSETLPLKPLAVSTRGYYLYNYTLIDS